MKIPSDDEPVIRPKDVMYDVIANTTEQDEGNLLEAMHASPGMKTCVSFCCGCSSTSTLHTLQQCKEHLRQQSKLHVPMGAQLYTDIVVRRTHVVKNAVKEATRTGLIHPS